jgi:hypothetical protein
LRYDAIFRDIAGSVLHDYAGFDEKKAHHDSLWFSAACQTAQRKGQLNDQVFFQLTGQYLATMQDRNLQLRLGDQAACRADSRGFHARSYQGRLYVTHAQQETRLHPGDQLITLNGTPPSLYRKRQKKNTLGSDVEEREIWGPVLKMSGRCLVKHTDGTDENLTLRSYPYSDKLPRLGGRLIGKNTLYLDLPHFTDPEAVEKLLASKEKSLARCSRLILDLRRNIGGTETAFIPLLRYVFREPLLLRDIYDDKGLYTNYTENNCRRKSQMLEHFLPRADRQSEKLVRTMMAELKEKSGQGMLWEPDEELAADTATVGGYGNFEKIIILSDTWCEYAGETFISLCKKSPLVTVIGRPTMGNIDYCNPVSVLYDNRFTFTYPMSKTKAAMEGKGVSGKGVSVDIHVPWTPAECEEDILLKQALKL